MMFTRFSGRTDSLTHAPTYRRTDPITECLRHRFSTVTEAYQLPLSTIACHRVGVFVTELTKRCFGQ